MLNQNLQGRKVQGLFSNEPYTGTVIESILESDGYNHIIQLDEPIVMVYNNPAQTKRNNRWVLRHVNYKVESRPSSFSHQLRLLA